MACMLHAPCQAAHPVAAFSRGTQLAPYDAMINHAINSDLSLDVGSVAGGTAAMYRRSLAENCRSEAGPCRATVGATRRAISLLSGRPARMVNAAMATIGFRIEYSNVALPHHGSTAVAE